MTKKEFELLSSDGTTKLHCASYLPDCDVIGIVQICHGMSEYIDRYDEFAMYLVSKGFLVVGNDHLGHGKSIHKSSIKGYFADKNGNECVINDIRKVHLEIKAKYPNVPYIIFGHSMGSFLARQYIILYGNEIDGAIIMGTGNQPPILTSMGMIFCKIIAAFKGWKHLSPFVNNLAMGSYNKKFGSKDGHEWLSANKQNVKEYNEDDKCGFTFTLNGFYNMFKGIKYVSLNKNIIKVNKKFPILLISGGDDPVGNFGIGVTNYYNKLNKYNYRNVSLKLYDGKRHEILKEDNRLVVFEDIYNWIKNIVNV